MQCRPIPMLLVTLAVAVTAAPSAIASQDLRSPDARDAASVVAQDRQDLRSPDARDAAVGPTVVPATPAPVQASNSDSSWFDLASAGIGAAMLLLIGGAGMAIRSRAVHPRVAV